MSRYLVVAHETAASSRLLEKLKSLRAREPEVTFTLLVPATPVRHLLFTRGDEQGARAVAQKRLDKARAAFTRAGLDLADARIGSESPTEAVDDELKARPGYAGVVVSTLPREKSRWIRMDLPAKVESSSGLPVIHVEAAEDWSAGAVP